MNKRRLLLIIRILTVSLIIQNIILVVSLRYIDQGGSYTTAQPTLWIATALIIGIILGLITILMFNKKSLDTVEYTNEEVNYGVQNIN